MIIPCPTRRCPASIDVATEAEFPTLDELAGAVEAHDRAVHPAAPVPQVRRCVPAGPRPHRRPASCSVCHRAAPCPNHRSAVSA